MPPRMCPRFVPIHRGHTRDSVNIALGREGLVLSIFKTDVVQHDFIKRREVLVHRKSIWHIRTAVV